MASATSDSAAIWEGLYENEERLEEDIQTDGSLMAFLEETQVGDAEDERLSDVIQSFEAEIDPANVGREEFILPNSTGGGGGHGLAEGSEEEPRGPCPIDDPFDWVDMEIVSSSIGNEMDQWYLDAFINELGHVDQFEDQVSYVDGFRIMASAMLMPLWSKILALCGKKRCGTRSFHMFDCRKTQKELQTAEAVNHFPLSCKGGFFVDLKLCD